jgi:hypothetical protein
MLYMYKLLLPDHSRGWTVGFCGVWEGAGGELIRADSG